MEKKIKYNFEIFTNPKARTIKMISVTKLGIYVSKEIINELPKTFEILCDKKNNSICIKKGNKYKLSRSMSIYIYNIMPKGRYILKEKKDDCFIFELLKQPI